MKKLFFLIISLIIIIPQTLHSQYYETGQDPALIRWKQIETPHFKLVFPESFIEKANSYANLLEKAFLNAQTLYPEIKGKLPVVIHNFSMSSNGYVVWAPKRIELYPLPGQYNQPDNPSQLLIMHEVTHVGEISSLRNGETKFLSFLFGEQATGVVTSMLPDWSLEGDAVYSETKFSNSGRGRSNSFFLEEKSICLDQKKIYDYNKMLFGSYRDFTPDLYVYGYVMMDYMRSNYPGFWEKNIAFTGRNSFLILPTNIMLRRKLHINKSLLYYTAIDSLKSSWIKSEKEYTSLNYNQLVPERQLGYASYLSPYMTSDGKIVALKTSLSDPEHFVLIDTLNKTEKNLLTTGYVYPSFFSYSNGKIVWAETHQDPRWDNRSYSVIKVLDLKTGKYHQITSKTRFSAPALSKDASSIVAVNTSLDLSTSLVIIDPHSGYIKHEIKAPGNVFLQRPEWSSDNKSIVAVTLSDAGEGIAKYDLDLRQWIYLVMPSHTDIEKAELYDDRLYILMQDKYSNNIYCKNDSVSCLQVSFSRYGISSFSISGDQISFSDYSKDGYNISSIPIKTSGYSYNVVYTNTLFKYGTESSHPFLTDTLSYNIKPYRRIGHLFNFHSWAPFYYNTDDILSGDVAINPGFTILSQNTLSTLISTFGVEFNSSGSYLHSTITWKGIYPVISVATIYGITDAYASYNIKASLPLYFSYGRFSQLFTPSIETYYSNDPGSGIFISPRFYFYNLFRMSSRDIYPRWGQVIDMRLKSALWDNNPFQTIRGFSSILFFPGFIKNHSTMIEFGYETQLPVKNSIFGNINTFPRGYKGLVSTELEKLSVDYTFPVLYPDFSAGRFLYLKRIRGSGFYDWASSNGTYHEDINKYVKGVESYSSTGAELLGDFYIFRFPYEITSGVRWGYKNNDRASFTEFVFSINIYGSTLGQKR
jgi:hypothetical protein